VDHYLKRPSLSKKRRGAIPSEGERKEFMILLERKRKNDEYL